MDYLLGGRDDNHTGLQRITIREALCRYARSAGQSDPRPRAIDQLAHRCHGGHLRRIAPNLLGRGLTIEVASTAHGSEPDGTRHTARSCSSIGRGSSGIPATELTSACICAILITRYTGHRRGARQTPVPQTLCVTRTFVWMPAPCSQDRGGPPVSAVSVRQRWCQRARRARQVANFVARTTLWYTCCEQVYVCCCHYHC